MVFRMWAAVTQASSFRITGLLMGEVSGRELRLDDHQPAVPFDQGALAHLAHEDVRPLGVAGLGLGLGRGGRPEADAPGCPEGTVLVEDDERPGGSHVGPPGRRWWL